MNWFIKCFRQYSDFNGRARRKEYWMFYLIQFFIGLILFIADMLLFVLPNENGFPILTILYGMAVMFPSMAVAVRRLHDIGKSGWWYLKFCAIIWLVCIVLGVSLALGKIYMIDILTYIGYTLIPFMIAAYVWLIVILCKDSEPHENKWGLNPKDPYTPEEDIVNIDCFKYFVKCMKHYVDFHGRASRAEYWMFFGVTYMVQTLFSVLIAIFQGGNTDSTTPISMIYLVYLIVMFIPALAVGVRRLHDIGVSGWYLAGALILSVILAIAIGVAAAMQSNVEAIVLMILLMILMLAFYIVPMLKGQPGENKWGPNPNEVNNMSETVNDNTIE